MIASPVAAAVLAAFSWLASPPVERWRWREILEMELERVLADPPLLAGYRNAIAPLLGRRADRVRLDRRHFGRVLRCGLAALSARQLQEMAFSPATLAALSARIRARLPDYWWGRMTEANRASPTLQSLPTRASKMGSVPADVTILIESLLRALYWLGNKGPLDAYIASGKEAWIAAHQPASPADVCRCLLAPSPDPREALLQLATRLTVPPWVAVAGPFNAGKSSLLNRILGRDLLLTGIRPTTNCPTVIGHGPPGIASVGANGAVTERLCQEDEIAAILAQTPADTTFLVVFTTNERLRHVWLLDTPGIDEPGRDDQATIREIERADALVWCTFADRAWTASEETILSQIGTPIYPALLAVTRADQLHGAADLQAVLSRVCDLTAGLFARIEPCAAPAEPIRQVANWVGREPGSLFFADILPAVLRYHRSVARARGEHLVRRCATENSNAFALSLALAELREMRGSW